MEKKATVIRTAEEAYEITKSNRASFEECLDMINSQAEYGNSFAIIMKEIDNNAIDELMGMGYNFCTVTDHFSIKNFKISWKQ